MKYEVDHMKIENEKAIKVGGWVNLVSSFLLFVWWGCLGIIFGAQLSAGNFTVVVQHPAWIPVNMIGLIATF